MSSQAQAFVPAHTAYPHLRNQTLAGRGGRPYHGPNAPVIYGAHGQPLSALPPQAPYSPEVAGYVHDMSPIEGGGGVGAGGPDHMGHRGGPDEPRTPTLPPPMTGGRMSNRRGSSTDYHYRDLSGQRAPGSPASSTTSYHAPYAHQPHPGSGVAASSYYAEAGRTPPQSYTFDRNSSSSPRDSSSTASSSYPFPGLHPPLVLPPRGAGEGTPPPPSAHHGPSSRQRAAPPPQGGDDRRPGMSIQNMLDQGPGGSGQGGRSATDHEMLDALMPRRRV